MHSKHTKRSIVIGLIASIALAAGAYAYWTAGGSGEGSGSAGTTTGLTANQTTVLTAMYPGDDPQTISGDFENTNAASVHVDSVTASILSVVKAVGAPAGTCDASDFTLTDALMTVDDDVLVGPNAGAWTGATIQFNNDPLANQDGCQGATVTLNYEIA